MEPCVFGGRPCEAVVHALPCRLRPVPVGQQDADGDDGEGKAFALVHDSSGPVLQRRGAHASFLSRKRLLAEESPRHLLRQRVHSHDPAATRHRGHFLHPRGDDDSAPAAVGDQRVADVRPDADLPHIVQHNQDLPQQVIDVVAWGHKDPRAAAEVADDCSVSVNSGHEGGLPGAAHAEDGDCGAPGLLVRQQPDKPILVVVDPHKFVFLDDLSKANFNGLQSPGDFAQSSGLGVVEEATDEGSPSTPASTGDDVGVLVDDVLDVEGHILNLLGPGDKDRLMFASVRAHGLDELLHLLELALDPDHPFVNVMLRSGAAAARSDCCSGHSGGHLLDQAEEYNLCHLISRSSSLGETATRVIGDTEYHHWLPAKISLSTPIVSSKSQYKTSRLLMQKDWKASKNQGRMKRTFGPPSATWDLFLGQGSFLAENREDNSGILFVEEVERKAEIEDELPPTVLKKSHKTTESYNHIHEKPRRRSHLVLLQRQPRTPKQTEEPESVCWRKKSSLFCANANCELRTPKRTEEAESALLEKDQLCWCLVGVAVFVFEAWDVVSKKKKTLLTSLLE
ncbi:hypothetical protein MUK42_35941 [Musa troglodytarum]|uniref:Uncharacterized protein n=1 Tax=Musa troglodytarum TaxID=320322 RepID=A0A9E7L660_9LILI|nr:hypothetical protein MUK42_35941 [Musa troglodytarum]URE39232.1 hypothetical protein MUK42_35941 [Musa troglodytarum]